MASLALQFQPNLLAVLSQFAAFETTLEKHLATATETSAGLIGTTGQSYMHFMNPNGQLADSIEVRMQDAHNAFIGSPLPYAHRREFSFEGPDSLGRMFPNDPAMLMFTNALADESMLREVAMNYIEAIYGTWNDLVGALPAGISVAVGMVA